MYCCASFEVLPLSLVSFSSTQLDVTVLPSDLRIHGLTPRPFWRSIWISTVVLRHGKTFRERFADIMGDSEAEKNERTLKLNQILSIVIITCRLCGHGLDYDDIVLMK